MMDSREFRWKVGILHGLGECLWEESGSIIRKISRIFITPQGQMGVSKSIVGGILVGVEEIDGTGMVIFSVGATDEQQKNVRQLWSNIIPANGARFKLDK